MASNWIDLESFKAELAKRDGLTLSISTIRSLVKQIADSTSLTPETKRDAVLYLSKQVEESAPGRAEEGLTYALSLLDPDFTVPSVSAPVLGQRGFLRATKLGKKPQAIADFETIIERLDPQRTNKFARDQFILSAREYPEFWTKTLEYINDLEARFNGLRGPSVRMIAIRPLLKLKMGHDRSLCMKDAETIESHIDQHFMRDIESRTPRERRYVSRALGELVGFWDQATGESDRELTLLDKARRADPRSSWAKEQLEARGISLDRAIPSTSVHERISKRPTPNQKVFISYSRVDEKCAKGICTLLEELGIDYFLDSKNVDWGAHVTQSISRGLEECYAVVVIISPASLKSQWVPFEIGQAMGAGKQILPFLIHPSLDLPDYIRSFNYKADMEDVRAYFERLVSLTSEEGSADSD